MVDIGKKIREALAKISGKSYLDKDTIHALMKEIQRALIAGDVNVRLVFQLTKNIEKKALESKTISGLTPRDVVVKLVYDELVNLVGEEYKPVLGKRKILLCGLYGSGKTTTAGKLAKFYANRGLTVALVGADTDRPAAREQLKQLAEKSDAKYYTEWDENDAVKIVKDVLPNIKENVIIVDSAGRNGLDEELRKELKGIYDELKPDDVFLVVSADVGQVAGKQAAGFGDIVPISGVIITKIDGSGKGGGALSSVSATHSKIAFVGTGEKIDDLEIYSAKKYIGRLLGIPDLEGLLTKIKKISEEENLENLDIKDFTIQTFYKQLKASKKMGPLSSLMSMMGLQDIPKSALREGEAKMKIYEAIINSMTPEERKEASLLRRQRSRITRIANGAGVDEKEVNGFLAQFEKVKKMLTRFRKDRGLQKKMENMIKGGQFKFPGM